MEEVIRCEAFSLLVEVTLRWDRAVVVAPSAHPLADLALAP